MVIYNIPERKPFFAYTVRGDAFCYNPYAMQDLIAYENDLRFTIELYENQARSVNGGN